MSQINTLKTISIALIAVVIGVVFQGIYFDFNPTKSIAEYYQMRNSNYVVIPGDSISEEELDQLKNCDGNSDCFLKYFYSYNLSHTLEQSLSKLTLLLKEHPEYSPNCHFVMHGIGKAQLDKENGDVGKALDDFESGKYFSNMTTCGTGYYHGVVEQAAKDLHDKNELAQKFQNICYDPKVKQMIGTDCLHGLGHASFIQTNYSVEDSKYVCDQNTSTEYDRFNCYTGIFMEGVISLPDVLTIAKTGNSFTFPMCEGLTDDLEKRACYYESPMAMQTYNPDKKDFPWLMSECKSVTDPVLRMGCIKNVSMRSIADVNYQDVNKLCLQTGLNDKEQVMCMAVFAHRTALSIAVKRNDQYYKIAEDICKNLPSREIGRCDNIIVNGQSQLYLVTKNDQNI